MISFEKMCRDSGIDINELLFIPSGGEESEESGFEIKPRDFLNLAKKSLRENNLIDAISNSKRAIDCQVDETLVILGINVNKNKALDSFIKNFSFEKDLSYKLKIIQALDLAPVFIVSEIRKLRHKLEHTYKLSSKNNVRRSIDIAELVIRSIEPKINIVPNSEFYITDKENYGKGSSISLGFSVGLSVNFNNKKKRFEVSLCKKDGSIKNLNIKPESIEYYAFLRLMNCIGDDYEVKKSISLMLKN